uniref:Uncharacterized protein n=1 Tax=Timspurckia oligopyrenoides TaxID=708627 RepID=A0A7S1EU04_9RHOD|mmetsp:Transcript_7866/g.14264  ORF Transcript_7866/g.14264 Transcript_7866/m.14264 type:complete len:423 (+) Transcript_7866:242-1510(+)|eukprot:CAMPEP_0182441946 /NCGR_PEP_ID=MMETSP1172-20130603/924_1 /TAXON_ID=708627 /ORGANISM="Timspurckia oligopyrenoides, Strain CCMP3278" /LENGTH=422 /DNA_ID=CAMNT_0024636555 /DNA_START=241 /DNA_END=1509 /DNA_ORIENTATION=+
MQKGESVAVHAAPSHPHSKPAKNSAMSPNPGHKVKKPAPHIEHDDDLADISPDELMSGKFHVDDGKKRGKKAPVRKPRTAGESGTLHDEEPLSLSEGKLLSENARETTKTRLNKFMNNAKDLKGKLIKQDDDELVSDDDDEDDDHEGRGRRRKRTGIPTDPEIVGNEKLNWKNIAIPSNCSTVTEIFLLSQNGIRSELMDLLRAVSALREKGENARDKQLTGFFKWFAEFGEWLHFYLELEDDVIIPFLSRQDEGHGGLRTEISASEHTSLSLQLNTIGNLKHQIGKNRNRKLSESLFKYVLNFSEHVMTDCAASEALLIPLFKELSGRKAADLAGQFDEKIRNSKYFELLAINLRSTDKEYRKSYLQRNLRTSELIKYRMVKMSLEHKRSITLDLAFKDNAKDDNNDDSHSDDEITKITSS